MTQDNEQLTSEYINVPDAQMAGAVVFWSLSGEVQDAAITAAIEDADLPEAFRPIMLGPATFISRAVAAQAGRHRLVRPMNGGGWGIVDETVGEGDLAYQTQCTVKLVSDDTGKHIKVTPEDHPIGADVRAAYDHFTTVHTTEDISMWLVRILRSMHAVSLRSSGGFYFIPHDHVRTWHTVVKVLRAVSDHSIYEIPTLRTTEALKAILDAIKSDADTVSGQIEQKVNEGELGTRALSTQAARARDMMEKVSSYEKLLGIHLGEIQARLETLQSAIAVAALAASAAKDEQ